MNDPRVCLGCRNTASVTGRSMPMASGNVFVTPSGDKPAGAVSLWGGATGQAFAARGW
jgi:hypothetical protein